MPRKVRRIDSPAEMPAVGFVFPEPERIPALTEAQSEALTVPDKARAIVVRDQETLDVAKNFLHSIDALRTQIDNTFDPQIAQAYKLHKSLIREKKKFTDPLDVAKRIMGLKVAEFIDEQMRIRWEAGRKRIEAEAKAREIAEKAVAKAEKFEADGKEHAAERIVNEAHDKVIEILGVTPDVPEEIDTSGIALRETWKFSIVNEALIPREYLIPDEKKIGRIVRALKGATDIPGIRVWSEKNTATRAEE